MKSAKAIFFPTAAAALLRCASPAIADDYDEGQAKVHCMMMTNSCSGGVNTRFCQQAKDVTTMELRGTKFGLSEIWCPAAGLYGRYGRETSAADHSSAPSVPMQSSSADRGADPTSRMSNSAKAASETKKTPKAPALKPFACQASVSWGEVRQTNGPTDMFVAMRAQRQDFEYAANLETSARCPEGYDKPAVQAEYTFDYELDDGRSGQADFTNQAYKNPADRGSPEDWDTAGPPQLINFNMTAHLPQNMKSQNVELKRGKWTPGNLQARALKCTCTPISHGTQ